MFRDYWAQSAVLGEQQMQRGNTLEKLPLGGDKQRAIIDSASRSLGSIILGKDAEISLALA
jgi:hypothetical protein